MPKRITSTNVILETLTDEQRDAMAKKFAALATIPDPIWNPAILWDSTFADKVFNVRDESSYDFENNKELFESLRIQGQLKTGDNMAFHAEPSPDGTIRFKTMVGNLRWTMMDLIRKNEIERREKEGLPADPDSLPFATVFGLVYTGLTEGQQTAIMADHIGRKDLNEAELCKEIGEFMEKNMLTDAQGVTKFGMEKNKLRRYRMRYAMPRVLAEFRKEKMSGGKVSYISIGQKQLDLLYAANLKDRDSGFKFRAEGPEFRLVWEKIAADPKFGRNPKDGSGKPPAPETKERKIIAEKIDAAIPAYGETPETGFISEALRWASGDEANVMEAFRKAAEHGNAMRDEILSLKEMIESLTIERDELSGKLADLQADYAGSVEMIESLRGEIEKSLSIHDSLRAEIESLKARKQNGHKSSR
jgi:hypothetical protein